MTTLIVNTDELLVHFTRWEALMARRATYAVPHTAITRVRVLPGWTSEVLGFRHGAIVVSGFLKVGVWKHPSGVRRLVSMKRGLPVLRIGLDRAHSHKFDEILISTPDASAVADELGGAGAA